MLIEVYKSKKELIFFDEAGEKQVYKIGIGKNEVGQKKLRNDMKTPEGVYRVCVKNDKSKFHLSLGINYPNLKDAEYALQDKRITQEQFISIQKSIKEHGGSDWSTPIGGEIYIHGGLEDKPWSEGCVRMFNKDIEDVYSKIKIGTQVTIFS